MIRTPTFCTRTLAALAVLTGVPAWAGLIDIDYQASFSGEVTHAPVGNPLHVTLGDLVFGHVRFQASSPIFNSDTIITTPDATLRVGVAMYIVYPGDAVTLRFSRNRLSSVGIINPEGVVEEDSVLPDVFFDYTQFFTLGAAGERVCAADSVCGTFDFTDSEVTVDTTAQAPEPANWMLALLGIAFLGGCGRLLRFRALH